MGEKEEKTEHDVETFPNARTELDETTEEDTQDLPVNTDKDE